MLSGMALPAPQPSFWMNAISRIAPAIEKRRVVYYSVLRLRIAGVAIAAAVLGLAATQLPNQSSLAEPNVGAARASFDPSTLISLHATVRATRPLADTGKIRFAISEGNARDYAVDNALDSL